MLRVVFEEGDYLMLGVDPDRGQMSVAPDAIGGNINEECIRTPEGFNIAE